MTGSLSRTFETRVPSGLTSSPAPGGCVLGQRVEHEPDETQTADVGHNREVLR
jgi:hypothetical protein